ncbi:hypothetical protein VIOR3934_16776 [Vibrio orientalis CIP 102891 = ATCC 33934]|uniref:ABC-type phosphate transport system, periplasmic component n=1 Tax=Vibrio orientalis CIP 102891 = ATCC 33934 TaxID=675816 RepID=C9QM69_VIBOR|nr:hypothetical protein [Vibrio orientalis]EEX93274.1 hypothetical protein VIA_003921 [Vibrio orientalis CIP 102891 = ATCC 33934]EGU50059.1 hypothetical protein VIOR3934_16776 [Vibrio orientalis CIP 102891 = ATCC 33934]
MRTYLSLLLLLFTPYSVAGLFVVVSEQSQINRFEVDDIADVYLGRTKVLDSLYINQVIDRKGEVRRRFFMSVTQMRESQVNAYWAKLKFSGSMRAPEQVESDSRVFEKLLANPQAVGYTAERPAIDSGIKVVLEINE